MMKRIVHYVLILALGSIACVSCGEDDDQIGWERLVAFVQSGDGVLPVANSQPELTEPCSDTSPDGASERGAIVQFKVGLENELGEIARAGRQRLQEAGFIESAAPVRAEGFEEYEASLKFEDRLVEVSLTIEPTAPDGRDLALAPLEQVLWLEYQFQPEDC